MEPPRKGGKENLTIINEPGLYAVIDRSDKAAAESLEA
jgi:prophage antirepressor-like protein